VLLTSTTYCAVQSQALSARLRHRSMYKLCQGSIDELRCVIAGTHFACCDLSRLAVSFYLMCARCISVAFMSNNKRLSSLALITNSTLLTRTNFTNTAFSKQPYEQSHY